MRVRQVCGIWCGATWGHGLGQQRWLVGRGRGCVPWGLKGSSCMVRLGEVETGIGAMPVLGVWGWGAKQRVPGTSHFPQYIA